jgi:hypothetical protein
MSDSDNWTRAKLQSFSAAASIVVSAVGLLVLTAWLLDLETLGGFLPSLATMKVNTALGFVLAGAAFWAFRLPAPTLFQRRCGQLAAVVVIVIGVLTLGEDIFGWELAIDQFLRADPTVTAFPGRMGYNVAINFILVGSALLLIDWQSPRGFSISQMLALIASAIAALAFRAKCGSVFSNAASVAQASARSPAPASGCSSVPRS